MPDPSPGSHRRFRVTWECERCGHEHTTVYEWPQQDRLPDPPACPECGHGRAVYHGAERV
jgi:rubredoxin